MELEHELIAAGKGKLTLPPHHLRKTVRISSTSFTKKDYTFWALASRQSSIAWGSEGGFIILRPAVEVAYPEPGQ